MKKYKKKWEIGLENILKPKPLQSDIVVREGITHYIHSVRNEINILQSQFDEQFFVPWQLKLECLEDLLTRRSLTEIGKMHNYMVKAATTSIEKVVKQKNSDMAAPVNTTVPMFINNSLIYVPIENNVAPKEAPQCTPN